MTDNEIRYIQHPAHLRLRRAARRERDALVQALGIEFDWRHHDGPEWAARYWAAFGDLERMRACGADQRLWVAPVMRQRRNPPHADSDAAAMRALFRHLLACLHPDVVPAAAGGARADQWRRVREAYRRGDRDALEHMARQADTHAYANGLRLPVPLLRCEYRRLRRMRLAVDRRLDDRARQFPYCLRDRLGEPGWVARKRRVWRHLLQVAAPERLAAAGPARQTGTKLRRCCLTTQ